MERSDWPTVTPRVRLEQRTLPARLKPEPVSSLCLSSAEEGFQNMLLLVLMSWQM